LGLVWRECLGILQESRYLRQLLIRERSKHLLNPPVESALPEPFEKLSGVKHFHHAILAQSKDRSKDISNQQITESPWIHWVISRMEMRANTQGVP
jgi:hypothetical protein